MAFLLSSGLSIPSIRLYVAAIRSYFAYHDIDVISAKFKRKVRMPKLYREDEQPIDAGDIRKILLSCNNRRLKVYLLVLASGAMRAVEALAVRVKDCDLGFGSRGVSTFETAKPITAPITIAGKRSSCPPKYRK